MTAELFIEYFPENGGLHTPLVLIHGHHIPTARELYHAIRALRETAPSSSYFSSSSSSRHWSLVIGH